MRKLDCDIILWLSDSEVCYPEEADRAHYEGCGLWWCENCDQWFQAKGSHDCTKNGTVVTTTPYFRVGTLRLICEPGSKC